MISARTNTAGLAAARVFTGAGDRLDVTANRVSSGLKVAGAIDFVSLSLLSADLGIDAVDYSNTSGALDSLDAARASPRSSSAISAPSSARSTWRSTGPTRAPRR